MRFSPLIFSLCLLTLCIFAAPFVYAESLDTPEPCSPALLNALAEEEIGAENRPANISENADQFIVPRIEDAKILQTLTCIQAEIPILEEQKVAAQNEVYSTLEEIRDEIQSEANFLSEKIESSDPKQAFVFKALLKGLKKRKVKTQSAYLGIMWKLSNAEIFPEEDSESKK